jgi:hypothetical protein
VVGAPIGAAAIEPTGAAVPDAQPAAEIEGPMRPSARAHFDRALSLFGTHDYAAAIVDLEDGYALDPRRDFLFAEAQAKRLGGDCGGAVALYQRFLTTSPPAVQASAAQIALGRCAQELANRAPVIVTLPAPAAIPPPASETRWSRDPWGVSLSAAGVVGLGIGVGYLAASAGARGDADAATSSADYARHWSTAETRLDVAVGALVIGGALAATGAARLLTVRRRARAAGLHAWVGPAMLSIGGEL